jgi:hypothetical protein
MSMAATPLGNDRSLRPGFLTGPLGWLTESLANLLATDHKLLVTLFELDPYRMHFLALGVAHIDPALPSLTIVEDLARKCPRISLSQILGSWPRGVDRVLHALPDTSLLAPQSYRALISVLRDKATAQHLHHCQIITEPLIVALANLPPPLRRPSIFKLLDEVDGVDRFVAGLQFLCGRAGVAFDDLVQDLCSLNQTKQFKAKITGLADSLPLPDSLPARDIGTFHRIDDPGQIRLLAKAWNNCLGDYLHEVNEGTSLIYHSNDHQLAALLARVNRLGWALVDIKGPKNIDVGLETGPRHHEAFAQAGIPRLADVAAIRSLLWQRRLSRRG